MSDLVGEVATEEASHLFGPRLPAVEKPTRGKVVELAVHVELQVRDEGLLVWVVRWVAEAFEDVLCGDVSRPRRYVRNVPPFSRGTSLNSTYVL